MWIGKKTLEDSKIRNCACLFLALKEVTKYIVGKEVLSILGSHIRIMLAQCIFALTNPQITKSIT